MQQAAKTERNRAYMEHMARYCCTSMKRTGTEQHVYDHQEFAGQLARPAPGWPAGAASAGLPRRTRPRRPSMAGYAGQPAGRVRRASLDRFVHCSLKLY